MRRSATLISAALFALTMSAATSGAQTASGGEPFPPGGIADVLRARIGKSVTLGLRSGKDVAGTVSEVREGAVVVTHLQGRDFYDAIVRLDDVSSVELRLRDR
jgi:hypothetical protein